MHALALGIATGLLIATSALAEEDKFSANSVLPYCRAALNNEAPIVASDAIMQAMCIATVDVVDFMMSNYPAQNEYRSCPPSDMTLRQVVQIVITYIDARPERMNESFKKLAIEAIREAWPCGTN
jgi:hypothetical protein